MATGDIPVENPGGGVTGTGTNEEFTLRAGKETLTVRTGGKPLKITVRSGDKTCTISPVDKKNWSLKIEAV
jgi:hypothetical protein